MNSKEILNLSDRCKIIDYIISAGGTGIKKTMYEALLASEAKNDEQKAHIGHLEETCLERLKLLNDRDIEIVYLKRENELLSKATENQLAEIKALSNEHSRAYGVMGKINAEKEAEIKELKAEVIRWKKQASNSYNQIEGDDYKT